MATQIIPIALRGDTTANWISANPVLLKCEFGVEILTSGKKRIKIGDGVTAWTSLDYSSQYCEVSSSAPTSSNTGYEVGTLWVHTLTSTTAHLYYCIASGIWVRVVTADEISALGYGDMMKSTYDKNNDGVVDKAAKLNTAQTVFIYGDGTASSSFDGSAALTLAFTLASSGVTVGTYTKVTVDDKGRVTAGQSLSSTDVPSITLSKITDAGSAAGYNVGVTSGTIPVLTTNGKIALTMIPDSILGQLLYGGTVDGAGVCTLTDNIKAKFSITELTLASNNSSTYSGVYFVASADGSSSVPSSLSVKTGDWIISNGSAGWAKIDNTDAVMSVNGKIGTVVLTTSDISEGTNLYYTAARFASAFSAMTTDNLAEGSTNLYFTSARANTAIFTDLVISGGTASSRA